jgi:hypothetical protein
MNLHSLPRTACALLLAVAGLMVQAQPTAASSQHSTRSGMAFAELEESVLKAQRDKRTEALEQLLGDDFTMVLAQDGGATVPREDWLDSAVKPHAGAWLVSQLTTLELGDVAVVNFVLRASPPRAGTTPLSVVDIWTRSDRASGHWRLAQRHVANAAGPRRGIPGDAATRAVIKKY